MDNETKYFNAISQFPYIGAIRFKKLLSYFNSLEDAWKAPKITLLKSGIEPTIVEKFLEDRSHTDPDKEFEKLTEEKIEIITIKDSSYPKALKEIYDPPAVLYIKGKITKEDKISVGIVGTRRCSSYGKQAASYIAEELAQMGITIVSGMAYGIDTLAHKVTLEKEGRTIAVLGGGINRKSIYPASNRKLAEKIASSGALISEYPPGTAPLKQNFPQRNRIISGLSLGILVVEAPEKSGAIITAMQALEQNREVFAIPGSIYSKTSFGTNWLIKMGAKLVTEPKDILEELNLSHLIEKGQKEKLKPENKEEEILLKIISDEPLYIDEIIKKSNLDTGTVNSTLSMLELKNAVKNMGGGYYVLIG